MWREGVLKYGQNVFEYWAKVFPEPSKYGINNGRISKLEIRCNNETVCAYDRGWDIEPTDTETKEVLKMIIDKYDGGIK